MGNHMCFSWEEEKVLFSGDLAMGWATSMVSPPDGDLTDFVLEPETVKTGKISFSRSWCTNQKPITKIARTL